MERYRDDEELEAILNTVTDVIITTDEKGNILRVNQSVERLFGYPPEELPGQNISVLMPESYGSEHQRYMANYMNSGVGRIIGIGRELVAKHKDGRLFPIHISVNKVAHLPCFVGVIRDLSELVKLENETLLIAEIERNRISRELHDELGQNLLGLSMQLRAITQKLSDTNKPLQQQLEHLNDELQHNVGSIRAIISELATIELEEQGLEDALKTFVTTCNGYNQTHINFICEGQWPSEDYRVSVQLYRIAREAIYNALKHANASCIDVSLLQQPDCIRLVIQDNGKGIPQSLIVRDSRLVNQGNGLRSIHFRAHVIGAHLTISSSAEIGTRIECRYSTSNHSLRCNTDKAYA